MRAAGGIQQSGRIIHGLIWRRNTPLLQQCLTRPLPRATVYPHLFDKLVFFDPLGAALYQLPGVEIMQCAYLMGSHYAAQITFIILFYKAVDPMGYCLFAFKNLSVYGSSQEGNFSASIATSTPSEYSPFHKARVALLSSQNPIFCRG